MNNRCFVLIALLVSTNAIAEDKRSPDPISMLLSASPVIGGLTVVGGGVAAASSFTVAPAPIDTELSVAAKQAIELDKKLKASQGFNDHWIRGYGEYYRAQSSEMNRGRWHSLQKSESKRLELYEDLATAKDFSHLKKTPGLEEALNKYTALSEELLNEQKSLEAYNGKQYRNPDPTWKYSPKGRSSEVIRAELNAHLRQIRAKFIEPSLKQAKLAEASSASKLGAAKFRRFAKGSGVLAAGAAFMMLSGQSDSDPVLTAINPDADSAILADLVNSFVKNDPTSIPAPQIIPAAQIAEERP